VDEATDIALEELGVNREDVEIVVVNPGRSGILGFGGEPAEVEVTLLETAPPEAAPAFAGDVPDDELEDEFEPEDDSETDEPARFAPPPPPPAPAAQAPGEGPRDEAEDLKPDESDKEVVEFASDVIDYFLASMNVVAVTYIRDEPEDGVPVFEIEGDDAGLLIGRRGETLQALQYLVNLIVTHQLNRSAYVLIDVEGYKERRRETLAGVAHRTAARAMRDGEPVELEPMAAYERRWIHIALVDSNDVRTESTGEGNDRRVVIYPRSEPAGPSVDR
jgi:spoIIIJ-associated protein